MSDLKKFRCPGCQSVFQFDEADAGQIANCPDCGTKLRLPGEPPPELEVVSPASRTRAPTSRAGGVTVRARPARRTSRGYWGLDTDRWAKTYALVWGIVLVAGILLPAFVQFRQGWGSERRTTTVTVWVWDQLEGADAEVVLAVVATLGAGILAIVVSRTMTGIGLGGTLFCASLVAFLLWFLVIGSELGKVFMGLGRNPATGPILVMTIMLLATSLIATGNHLRKLAAATMPPRTIEGIGGCLLLLGFLLPVFDDNPMIAAFFEESGWENATGIMLCLLALLAYGILGIVSFAPGPMAGLTITQSILARLLMAFFPLILVITISSNTRTDFGIAAITYIKGFAVIYGLIALISTGLAAWVAPSLESRQERIGNGASAEGRTDDAEQATPRAGGRG